ACCAAAAVGRAAGANSPRLAAAARATVNLLFRVDMALLLSFELVDDGENARRSLKAPGATRLSAVHVRYRTNAGRWSGRQPPRSPRAPASISSMVFGRP